MHKILFPIHLERDVDRVLCKEKLKELIKILANPIGYGLSRYPVFTVNNLSSALSGFESDSLGSLGCINFGSDFGNDCNQVEESKNDGIHDFETYLRLKVYCCPNTMAWRMKSL